MTLPVSTPAAFPLPGAQAGAAPKAPTREQLVEAARQFDAVFVRIVLSSLEKTTKVGGGSSLSAGQSAYGSMVVDTVADAVTRAGGTGLADKLLEALGPRLAPEATAPGGTPGDSGKGGSGGP